MAALPKLERIRFNGSLFTSFPRIKKVKANEGIMISPTNLHLLKNIKRLDFYYCKLKTISNSLNKMVKLKHLGLVACRNIDIGTIGTILSKNTTIESLRFTNSRITYLPNTFCNMPKLKMIYLNTYDEHKINHWRLEEVGALNKMPPDETLLFKIPQCGYKTTFKVIGNF